MTWSVRVSGSGDVLVYDSVRMIPGDATTVNGENTDWDTTGRIRSIDVDMDGKYSIASSGTAFLSLAGMEVEGARKVRGFE